MLEFFSIFSKGGIVIWFFQLSDAKYINPINGLINNVLLEEKVVNNFHYDKLTLEYSVNNENDLIFVAAYNSLLTLPYVKSLINMVEDKFIRNYKKSSCQDFSYFNKIFDDILETKENQFRKPNSADNVQNIKNQPTAHAGVELPCSDIKNGEFNTIINLKPTNDVNNKELTKNKKKTKSKKKEARVWNDKLNKKDIDILDYSDNKNMGPAPIMNFSKFSLISSSKNIQSLAINSPNIVSDSNNNGIFGFFKGLIGAKIIDIESIRPAISKMKNHLIC
ncbi:hypothetical protein HZS_973, partial [Henneguya salminicola]